MTLIRNVVSVIILGLTVSVKLFSIGTTVRVFNLGDAKVSLQIYTADNNHNQYVFVHVHENEKASLEAGFKMLQKYGGKLLTLKHSTGDLPNRNITFNYKGKKYEIDPNRIFSTNKLILIKTLNTDEKNELYIAEAADQVESMAKAIWEEISNAPCIVALHNNKNFPEDCHLKFLFGAKLVEESYNITSYVQKSGVMTETTRSAADIYINPAINNSEFFIVTLASDFKQIAERRFNVVLQHNQPVDDGSLSVLSQQKSMRYINAEAKHENVHIQFEMLEILHDIITGS
ncbi:MAG: hypothetical protein IPN29_10355 [Saprospiraceae bacterium]|nr:hypothetical protein [Saprospiraceae bacterium]